MKPIFPRVLPLWTGLLWLGAATAPAQVPKPAADAPKPPVHKPEQSVLNRLKQDERSKKQIGDSAEKLREAAKHTETAEKELKRINSKDLKEDPGNVIESMKDKLDPAALKELQEKAKEVLDSEDGKKLIEEVKKKAAASTSKPKTATTTPPGKFGPSTFDQVPAPVPVVADAPQAKVRTTDAVVNGDTIIFPPSQDPANTERALPASDPRSRTYVIVGGAQVKTPSIVLDADRIEFINSAENGGEGIGGLGAPPKKSPAKPKGKAIDPVSAGAGATDSEKSDPFEMIIATGRVNIVRIDKGKVVTGKGGSMIYRKKTGEMILTDWPEVQDGKNVLVARQKNAKIVLIPKGQPYSEGCQLLTLDEAKSNGAAAKPTPPPRAQPVE